MSPRPQDPDASRLWLPISSCTDDHLDHGNNYTTSDLEASKQAERGSLAMEDLLRPLIVVKVHPPNLTTKPRSLQPLMLLPREHLRLSFLDLSSPYGSFESSLSFESNIRILDLESRMGARPVVLIARLESNKSVYAIERQADALYTLCHLGSWVDLEQLCGQATVSCAHLIRKRPGSSIAPSAPRPLTTPQTSHENKKRRLAIEAIQSLVKKPARSQSISTQSQPGGASQSLVPVQETNGATGNVAIIQQDAILRCSRDLTPTVTCQGVAIPEQDETPDIPDTERILDNIRNQYLETLYHSMGSLAYFAKGPLSRARAAFHLDCDSTLEMNDLIDFLKSLVMTTVQIDKKYRETIPDIQSKMKTAFEDSDAEQGQEQIKARRRRVKKMRLGKDGLYPNEDDHIRKWWTVHRPQSREESTTKSTEQHDTKLQISRLRSRETQLQMIIILEILALEPLLVREIPDDSKLPGLPLDEFSELPKEVSTKKRNKHNLPFLLDIHADRLCIWQSIALDEVNLLDDTQVVSRSEAQKSSTSASDPLKDFCVDIVVPFFSARLPEYCDSINRKLGGPAILLPSKSNEKKPEQLSKAKAKPGTATKRPAPSKSARTLETVLSKETERNRRSMSRGPRGVIALMRSASTPTIPLLKREASEPLTLTNIPKAESSTSQQKLTPSARPATAKRSWTEAKEKRDAFIKAELQDAISTLRRPNRDVVGKAMAEAVERRATTSLSQLKKSRKPTQHHQYQNIVKATPVGNRFHDVLATGPDSQSAPLQKYNTIPEETVLPSSSMVPSSAPRKRDRAAAFGNELSAPPKLQAPITDQITATPAKPSTINNNFLSVPEPDEGVVLGSSPVIPRKILQPRFPAMARPTTLGHRDSGIEMPSSPRGPSILAETPIKPRKSSTSASIDRYVTVTPIKRTLSKGQTVPVDGAGISKGKENGVKMTIFERLGWNDDDDDLV
ncbi:DNA replication regulator SLD3-domain-containing protein [Xylariaceae sp. FL1651]|nr:DNA replication regulator SLD3-domain-containing protein [Xylariaceae sp. FL1651]